MTSTSGAAPPEGGALSGRGRDPVIDAAKGIAIVLVVLAHAKGVPALFSVLAYSFHVPLFFFLSGWVLEAHGGVRSYLQSLSRLARTLLVPYLCFFLLGYGYWLLSRHVGEKALRWGNQPWWEPWEGLFTGIGPRLYVHPAIWFLVAMFVTVAVYLAVRRWCSARAIAPLAFIAAWLWIGFFPSQGIRLPMALDILPVSLFFFAVGAVSSASFPATVPSRAIRIAVIMLVGLLPPWAWLALANGRVDINQLQFGLSEPAFFAASLSGIAIALCLARLLQRIGPLRWMGRNTLLILCTHILVFFVLSGVASLAGWFPGGRPGPAWALLVTAMALAASVPLKAIFMAYAPWMIGARTPWRPGGGT
jgi:acyltransferase